MANSDSDSEQELFPIEFQVVSDCFCYEDHLSLCGMLRAVASNDLDKVKCLVSHGKSVNINDNNGNTALHIAVLKNLYNVVSYLLSLEEILINVKNFNGNTPLLHAAKKGNISIAKQLIQAGCDVNLPNLELVTPLHAAVKHPELARLLIENGADIEALDYSKETPLQEAINESAFETVCLLLYFNADVNTPADNGLTPFMRALILENLPMQEVLLDYVSDFNAITNQAMTVLNLALTHSCPFVEEIIKRGADVNYQHNFLNVFMMCLRVPNLEKFKIVWKYYSYQDLGDIDYFSAMLSIINDTYYIYHYLHIIIDSGNVDPFFQFFPLESYLSFARGASGEFPNILVLTPEIVCLYLSYGHRLTGKAVGLIFKMFGQSELLNICLHMDMDVDESDVSYGLARVLYDTKLAIDELKIRFSKQIEPNTLNESLLELMPYFKLDKYHLPYGDLFDKKREVNFLCEFPSLVELARNKARAHIIEKFKLDSSKQYYLYLNCLEIPKVYRDILTFQRPIYKI